MLKGHILQLSLIMVEVSLSFEPLPLLEFKVLSHIFVGFMQEFVSFDYTDLCLVIPRKGVFSLKLEDV